MPRRTVSIVWPLTATTTPVRMRTVCLCSLPSSQPRFPPFPVFQSSAWLLPNLMVGSTSITMAIGSMRASKSLLRQALSPAKTCSALPCPRMRRQATPQASVAAIDDVMAGYGSHDKREDTDGLQLLSTRFYVKERSRNNLPLSIVAEERKLSDSSIADASRRSANSGFCFGTATKTQR